MTHTAANQARSLTGYRDHTIVGTPAHIGNVLANHTRTGTLVAATAPRPATTNPDDPRVLIRVRLRAAPPLTRTNRLRAGRQTRRITAIAVTATAAVTGVLAATAYLLGVLVEFVTAHPAQIGGVLVVLAILGALGSRTTRRHCPGC
jgi:hypothetical protein